MTLSMREHLVLATWTLLFTTGAAQNKNVLLIFGDDAGFQMGAYNNTVIKTPHFDALASRSVVFRHGFTSVSSCSPSRSVLLTGLPQHENGQYGLAHGPHHFSSFDNIQSLPVILGKHGIRTGIIGKKHVQPDKVYKFDFEATEEEYDLNQIGRNITFMKETVHKFLSANDSRPFFLYLAFHDPHRCSNTLKFGQFCERFGNGQPGNGVIPDWQPAYYNPDDIQVPYYLPNTPAARQDLANMYTTYSRMDQGIGLFMKELEAAGHADDTLVLYTADNGIPFPNAKTNLYEPGMGEPMMISNPDQKQHWNKYTDAMASTMDFTPTILDWFGVQYPDRSHNLTGKSLLPVTTNPDDITNYQRAFSSHNLHEVTMYYPMRVIRTPQYRLIHNLNYPAPYPMATDIYSSPTFLDIVNRTEKGQGTMWFKSLQQYYYRDQFELFDLSVDFEEMDNLAYDPAHSAVFKSLMEELMYWQKTTQDTWLCAPSGVLLDDGQCHSNDNGE